MASNYYFAVCRFENNGVEKNTYMVYLYEEKNSLVHRAQVWRFDDSDIRSAKRRAEGRAFLLTRQPYSAKLIDFAEAEAMVKRDMEAWEAEVANEADVDARSDAADYAEDCHSGLIS